jgi:cytochrome c-type biogenesis protein CcmH
LLTLNPPETLIPLIEERIAAPGRMPAATAPGCSRCRCRRELRRLPCRGSRQTAAQAALSQPGLRAAQRGQCPVRRDGIRIEVSIDPALAARLPRAYADVHHRPQRARGSAARSHPRELGRAADVGAADRCERHDGRRHHPDQPELELIAGCRLVGQSGAASRRPVRCGKLRARQRGPTRITIDRIAE